MIVTESVIEDVYKRQYQSSYFGEIREFETGGHKGNDYAAPAGTPTLADAGCLNTTAEQVVGMIMDRIK